VIELNFSRCRFFSNFCSCSDFTPFSNPYSFSNCGFFSDSILFSRDSKIKRRYALAKVCS
jgi:hypothetical protein